MEHGPEPDRRDAIRNQPWWMAVQDHIDVRVPLEDLAVDEAFQGPRGIARVDGFRVRDAVLADVVKPGHKGRRERVHHEERWRIVRIPHREMAEAVEDAMVVEDV
jgi:hypothetical protein